MDYKPKKSLDIWLNDKGFYRKHVPMDETCFFRAISDQVYNTQIYHEDLRKQCVEYAQNNQHLFGDLLASKQLEEHLYNLKNHCVICGNIEIQIMSKMLERDFIIIDSENFKIQNVTQNNFKKAITLCRMRDNHYDSVLPKAEVETAGFCQSIIYKLLYEDIFGFEKVDDIVTKMLYPDDVTPPVNTNLFDAFLPPELDKNKDEDNIQTNPPFPYKVAKALDPKQYRNIEFDAWNQTRKELRLKDWYMGGDDFKVGTKCLFVIDSNSYECYIQELCYQGKENICLIYVVAWASKEMVKREELMPMPDAKPWPLPYTISKNIDNSSVETVTTMTEDMKISYKRRKNVRRFMNTRTFNNSNMLPNDTNNNRNEVSSLEGCALIASPGPYIEENLNPPLKNENSNIIPYEDTILSYENNIVPYEYNDNNESNNQFSNVITPYSSPYDTLNPQMSVAAQYNAMIQEERNNTKVTTVYSKFVEKTYSNNNISMPNLNNPTPPPSPGFPVYTPNNSYQMPVVPGNFPEQLSIMPAPIYPVNQPVQPVPVHYSDGNILGIMPVPSPAPVTSPEVTLGPIFSAPVVSNYCWTCNWIRNNRLYCNTFPEQYFHPVVPAPCYPALPGPAPPVQDNICYDYEPQYPPSSSPHCLMWHEDTY